ncbi:DsbA family oxidoreductase [Achromobacter insolitus]|uniref:DsbA family oxidoreductase n=1 Tax=Achromobacter insolitus TaxID=217204 RepID=UPI0028AE698B|nr:DsbA family protein [Achromobacter insolitus]
MDASMISTPDNASSAPLTVDFFHDVVCGWCYVMSPRLRQVAAELGIAVRQRSFVLQDTPEQMCQVFGSMERAKQVILGHWEACARHDDLPRIDVEGMRAEPFDYPSGMAGALACQAAHLLGGDAGHWDMFDAIQHAHLSLHRNVGDSAVLLDIATELGHDREEFAAHMHGPMALQRVQADREAAARMAIDSIPTLIAGPHRARLRTMSTVELRDRLLALMPAPAPV